MPTLGTLLSDLDLTHDLDDNDCLLALSDETDTAIKHCLAQTKAVKDSNATVIDGLSGPQIELNAPISKANRRLLIGAKDDISRVHEPGLSRVYIHETRRYTSLVIRFHTPCPFTGDGKPFVGL